MSRRGGSRDEGMSGANNIPLGNTRGGGTLAAAASSLGGISLLNPSYMSGGGPDPGGSHQRGPPPSSSGSSRRSKFGPPVEGMGPPPVMTNTFPNMKQEHFDEPVRKRPNMDIINNINAQILGKIQSGSPGAGIAPPKAGGESSKEETREERRKKRKSRWGGADGAEKTFIPGMPTMMPQGLSPDQEEAYLHRHRRSRFTRPTEKG